MRLDDSMSPIMGSSNIKSAGYDDKAHVLRIDFTSGGHYLYFDVPPDLMLEFWSAESKGKFFQSKIKPKFKFEKLLPTPEDVIKDIK